MSFLMFNRSVLNILFLLVIAHIETLILLYSDIRFTFWWRNSFIVGSRNKPTRKKSN